MKDFQKLYFACITLLASSKSLQFTVDVLRTSEMDEAHVNLQKIIKTENDFLSFQILSSKERIHVYIDSKQVLSFETTNNLETDFKNTSNGLHLVAVNPKSTSVVMKRHFMTELYGGDTGIPMLLNTLTNGEIIVLAAKYDAALNLAPNIRSLFQSLGALRTQYSSYRSFFVWAFVNGGKTLVESITDDNPTLAGEYWSSPINVHVLIPRDIQSYCWKRSDKAMEIMRATFCYNYGGYRDLCKCDSPLDLNIITPELKKNMIRNVPILLIASNRPHSLLKCILTILNQPGGHKENIIVAIDGEHAEVNQLLELLKIRYFVHRNSKENLTAGGRISDHYWYALSETLRLFPSSEFVIVLEEDLLTAPDFMSFFSQAANILASDNSLYCINAWNDLSAMHTGGNTHRLMRQETQPSCGWMMRMTHIEEALKIWPSPTLDLDWDLWSRGAQFKSTRECLVPEISRTFHLGESGSHVNGQFTLSQITGHLTTGQNRVQLKNLPRLSQAQYEDDLYELLTSDGIVFLNTTLHPCDSEFIPRNFTEKVIVLFFWMETTMSDTDSWYKISSCFGLFNMDARNHHHGLIQFYFYGTRIFAIGYPFSDYSFIKPVFVTPVSDEKSEWDLKNLHPLSVMNRRRFRVPEMERHMPFKPTYEMPTPKRVFHMLSMKDAIKKNK